MGASTRPQARRRRAAHLPPVNASEIASLATHLLPHTSGPSEHALHALLASHTPQNQVTAGMLLSVAPPSKALTASLLAALPAWHEAHPAAALAFFARAASDLRALPPALHVLPALAPRARAALPPLLPHLAPVLQTAVLWLPRAPSSTSLRVAALAVITALADACPTAPLALLPLLQPESALPCLLAHPHTPTRSAAVSAATALVRAFAPLLRHASPRPAPHTAFAPSSLRARAATAALYPSVAAALLGELRPVVVAKLARLASILAAALPAPPTSSDLMQPLVQALLVRVVDTTTDRTSRAASAAALAVAVGKSGPTLDSCGLRAIVQRLVVALHARQGDSELPLAEVLVVLRAAIDTSPALFSDICGSMRLPVKALLGEMGSTHVLLHLVRLVATFVTAAAESYASSSEELGEEARVDARRDVTLAWDMYQTVLKRAVHDHDHPAQSPAVLAVGDVLHLCTVRLQLDPTAEIVWQDRQMLCDALRLLMDLAVGEGPQAVRMSALIALSNAPLSMTTEEETHSLLHFLQAVLSDERKETSLRAKAFNSFVILVDVCLRESSTAVGTSTAAALLQDAAEAAVLFLKASSPSSAGGETGKSTGGRSVLESTRIGALNLIACALRHLPQELSPTLLPDEHGEGHLVVRQRLASEMASIVCGKDSTNTKCICCKAMGQVLRALASRGALPSADSVTASMVQSLHWGLKNEPARLQLAAGKAIATADITWASSPFTFATVMVCVEVFEENRAMLEKEDEAYLKERSHMLALQETLQSLVYSQIASFDGGFWDELVSEWVGKRKALSLCNALATMMCQHMCIPRRILDVSVAIPVSDADGSLFEHSSADKVLIDSLSQEAQGILQRIAALTHVNKQAHSQD